MSGECRAMLVWPAWDTTTRFSSLIKYIFISCHPIAAAEITNHSREAKHKPGGKLTPNTCSLLPLFRQFECCSHFLCTTALITYHYTMLCLHSLKVKDLFINCVCFYSNENMELKHFFGNQKLDSVVENMKINQNKQCYLRSPLIQLSVNFQLSSLCL